MKFVNPHAPHAKRGPIHFILWQLGFYKDQILPHPLPKNFVFPNKNETYNPKLPLITWINHSTFWIRCDGVSILVDPIWNQRASPVNFLGPQRRMPPALDLGMIDRVDYVLISHDHYDHLDKKTVIQLQKKYPKIVWVVPRGVKKRFHRWFLPSARLEIIELTWWERITLGPIRCISVPAQHFSGRGIFDRDRSLWMGYVCEFPSGKRLYFAGDTGYNPLDFKNIGKIFHYMDLSLLPIGVYKPRKFMQPIHVNPLESLMIHKEVGSKLSIGGHWGTFKLSSEEMDRPPFDLFLALQAEQISVEEFRVLKPGQSINW